MIHSFEKITCTKENCNDNCIKIIRPDSVQCFPKVPFFATYHRWGLENIIAYKHKQDNMYYVRQSLRRIFENAIPDPPVLWRPHFWAMKNKHQKQGQEQRVSDPDVRTIDDNTLMGGEGMLTFYDNSYHLIGTKKITHLSIHDGRLSDNQNFGLDKLLQNYYDKYIFVVWKWHGTDNRYDETLTYYGLYDFSSDLILDKDKRPMVVNDRNFKEPVSDQQLNLIQSKLKQLKQIVEESHSNVQEAEEEQKKKLADDEQKRKLAEERRRIIEEHRQKAIKLTEEQKTLLNAEINRRKNEIMNIQAMINNKDEYGLQPENITMLQKDIRDIMNPTDSQSLEALQNALISVEKDLQRFRNYVDQDVRVHVGQNAGGCGCGNDWFDTAKQNAGGCGCGNDWFNTAKQIYVPRKFGNMYLRNKQHYISIKQKQK